MSTSEADADSTISPSQSKSVSLLTTLPLEVRLMIYELLLLRSTNSIEPSHEITRPCILPSSNLHYSRYLHLQSTTTKSTTPTHVLRIQTEEPSSYEARRANHARTRYMVRCDRFRARCMYTTYHLLQNPSLHTSILLTSAKVHAEASEILYSSYTFDFDTHVEAVVPFLSDLTPMARSYIRSIRLVKKALPYEKEFDLAEWSNAISYIAENLTGLRSLYLGIVAGKPGPGGWDMVLPYTLMDLEYLMEMDGMEWVEELMTIRGLQHLEVEPIVEHCPPSTSNAMARYIRFSASIDGSFTELLRAKMVG